MLVLGKLALLCKLIKKESSTKLNIILYFAFKKRYVIHRIKRIFSKEPISEEDRWYGIGQSSESPCPQSEKPVIRMGHLV